jgi:2-dehydro-3-deoxygluconokinase
MSARPATAGRIVCFGAVAPHHVATSLALLGHRAALAGTHDWPALLDGAAWLYATDGGSSPAAVVMALAAARAAGVRTAFDGAPHPEAMDMADVLFAGPRDIAAALDRPALAGHGREQDAAHAAFAAFPHMELLACMHTNRHGANVHELSAVLHTRTAAVTGGSYRLAGTVDRTATGGAFAAGVLHGLQSGMALADVAGFALAAAAMKHAIAGDTHGRR